METRYYSINIQAAPDEVYTKMLDKTSFETWTAVFNPTSTLKGNWTVGSTMCFIATQEDGTTHGMLSRIIVNRPGELLVMEHYGTLVKGKEITDDETAKALKGLREEYVYIATKTGTRVEIKTDLLDEWVEYMDETYPRALLVLKEICEN